MCYLLILYIYVFTDQKMNTSDKKIIINDCIYCTLSWLGCIIMMQNCCLIIEAMALPFNVQIEKWLIFLKSVYFLKRKNYIFKTANVKPKINRPLGTTRAEISDVNSKQFSSSCLVVYQCLSDVTTLKFGKTEQKTKLSLSPWAISLEGHQQWPGNRSRSLVHLVEMSNE